MVYNEMIDGACATHYRFFCIGDAIIHQQELNAMKAFVIMLVTGVVVILLIAAYHFFEMTSYLSDTTHTVTITSGAISPDGKYLATCFTVSGGVTFDDMTEVILKKRRDPFNEFEGVVLGVDGIVPVSASWDNASRLVIKVDIRGNPPYFTPSIARQVPEWNGIAIKYDIIR